MADFFDKVKQGLGKGMTTVSIKSKEMLDANKLKSEIAACETQKKDAIVALGMTVCTMVDGGQVDAEALKLARAAIGRVDAEISQKQKELVRVHADAQQALSGTGPVVTCACGAVIAQGAKFCPNCGKAS
jgi:GTP1/Obg family GTP-binding protein